MKPGDLVKLHPSLTYIYVHDEDGCIVNDPVYKTDGFIMVVLGFKTFPLISDASRCKVLMSNGKIRIINKDLLCVINEAG